MKRSLKRALHALADLPAAPFAIAIIDDRDDPPVTVLAPAIDPRVGATALVIGRAGTFRGSTDDEQGNRQLLVLLHASDPLAIEARDLRSDAGVRDGRGERFVAARLLLPCVVDLGGALAVIGRPGALHDDADAFANGADALSPRCAHSLTLEAIELASRTTEFVPAPPTLLGFSLARRPEPTEAIDLTELGLGLAGARRRIHGETITGEALVEGFFIGRSGRCDWPSFVGERFRSLSRLHGVICASNGDLFYCDTNSTVAKLGAEPAIVRVGRSTDVRLTAQLRLLLMAEVR
ncbi:MAG: hypothetical protein IT381_11615 [Deltaproteobacteria bacterium]|nr:hypothetical protein [Deltaproteobacteria bacterium]